MLEMIILNAEANQILNDETMLKIIGWVITTLLFALGGLITYIWRARKKQLDLTSEQQAQLNIMFQEEHKDLSEKQAKQSKEQASINEKLNVTMEQIGKSMDEFHDFLKDSEKELRNSDKELHGRITDLDGRVSKVEGIVQAYESRTVNN